MDPNFIHMDWERTFDAIVIVAVLAIIVERALSVVFQSRFYIVNIHKDGLKESLALIVSIVVCWVWKFDAMGMILLTGTNNPVPGYIVTGALVAGGSKGSLKLFQDFFDLQSTAFRMRHALQAAQAAETAESAEAEAVAAPDVVTAEMATAKAEKALKKVQHVAAKAAAAGRAVPSATVQAAVNAVANAKAAVKTKPS